MKEMQGFYYARVGKVYYNQPQEPIEEVREDMQEKEPKQEHAEQADEQEAKRPAEEIEQPMEEKTEQPPQEEPKEQTEEIPQEEPAEEKPIQQPAAENRLLAEAEANREQVRSCLEQVREDFGDLQGSMRKLFREMQGLLLLPSLEKLARVQQQMSLADAEQTRVYAMELTQVLCGFGAKQTWPEPGAAFDPARHERRSMEQHGAVVCSCHGGGWELEDTVLVKAIVDIA